MYISRGYLNPSAGPGVFSFGRLSKHSGGQSSWSVDATSGIGVPTNADQWSNLITAESLANWSVPTSVYLCQDAAAPLVDEISGFDLTFSGSGQSYQQSVTGWTRLAADLTDGATAAWTNTDAGLPDISTTSCLLLAYVLMPTSAPGATRQLIGLGTSGHATIRMVNTSGLLQVVSFTVGGLGSINMTGYGVVPLVLLVNQTTNQVFAYTPYERIGPVFSASMTGKSISLGAAADRSANASYLYAARWDGASAERSDQDIVDLLRALGYSPTWSIDATSSIGVPANAFEWGALISSEALTASTPSNLWRMQEASGNLTDSIGGLTLSHSGTKTYANAVAGWSRVALGTTDGVAGAWTVGSGFGPNPSTTSVAALLYVRIDNATAERSLLAFRSAANDWVLANVLASGVLRGYCDTSSGASSVVYEGGGVFPLLLVYDRTNSRFHIYTNQEKFTVTYGAVGTDGTKGFGAIGANPTTAFYLYGCWWSGAAAEALSTDANAKALLEALGWTVTGY